MSETLSPARRPILAPRAPGMEVAERLRQRIFKRELEPAAGSTNCALPRNTASAAPPARSAPKVLAAEGW